MRKVVRAVFDDPHGLSPEKVADSKDLKALVKSHAPEAVRLAFEHGKKFATLFEINDSTYYVELPRKSWVQALETCMLWYVEDEDYEACKRLKDLINAIQNKANKNKLNIEQGGDGF